MKENFEEFLKAGAYEKFGASYLDSRGSKMPIPT